MSEKYMGVDPNDRENVIRLVSMAVMRKAIEVAEAFEGEVDTVAMANFEASVMLPSPLLAKFGRIPLIVPLIVENEGRTAKCASLAFPLADKNDPQAVDPSDPPRPLILIALLKDESGGTSVGMEMVADSEDDVLAPDEQLFADVLINLHRQIVDLTPAIEAGTMKEAA